MKPIETAGHLPCRQRGAGYFADRAVSTADPLKTPDSRRNIRPYKVPRKADRTSVRAQSVFQLLYEHAREVVQSRSRAIRLLSHYMRRASHTHVSTAILTGDGRSSKRLSSIRYKTSPSTDQHGALHFFYPCRRAPTSRWRVAGHYIPVDLSWHFFLRAKRPDFSPHSPKSSSTDIGGARP